MTLTAHGPTPERLALAAEVARLRAAGLTYREVGASLGISRSHASMLATDPDGAKVCARREGYKGVCERCGGETKSDGTSRPSRVCAACAVERQRESKVWTREVVIDAIRRFAAEHGRPPTSTEWITADPVRGYPPRSAVYGGADSSSAFATWSDAIEAAGFPRPRQGKRAGDTSPSVMREVLHDLQRLDRPFRWREVAQLVAALTGGDSRAEKYTSGYLNWWRKHGYVVRLARGQYATTEKRYRDEQAAA